MRHRGIGLAVRLLLLSSLLLTIPWLGYRHIEGMKQFLLKGQEEAQLLAAQALATVLHDRGDLFGYGDGGAYGLDDGDVLPVYPLKWPVQLDGYGEEWAGLRGRARTFGEGSDAAFSLLLGQQADSLYGFLRVRDRQRVYRQPQYRALDTSDQVRLALVGAAGEIQRYLLVSEGEGSINAYRVRANWRDPVNGQPLYALRGSWRETAVGYDLEFRFPRDWLGAGRGLSLAVVDVDDPRERAVESVVSSAAQKGGPGLNRLIIRSPELERILKGLDRADAVICVVDRERRVLAVRSGPDSSPKLCADTDRISRDLVKDALAGVPKVLHRRPPSGTQTLIVAAHPVYSGEQVMGAVLLEKDSAHILGLQYQTLLRAAGSTLLVWGLLALGLLLFAAWLAFRIRQLRREVAGAIDADGRVLKSELQAGRRADDDLGALSRDISELLARLQRYTGFLESVPRTLRHELLNPLNVIAMSLQRLEQGGPVEGAATIRTGW